MGQKFPTANPLQSTNRASSVTAFVAKLNAAGNTLLYSTYLGGSGAGENGNGIAVDSSGNAYVTGSTGSSNFPTKNPFQSTRNGPFLNAFITKLDASGAALVYSSYLGGSDLDRGFGIAVDAGGNAYITGSTQSNNFPRVNAFQSTYGGVSAFVAKVNAAGSALIYSSYLGGSNIEQG